MSEAPMIDRPVPSEAALSGPTRRVVPRWPLAFVGFAGLMGGAGVLVAAAGDHLGGGDLARTASDFLLVHAAVVTAASAVALALARRSVLLMLAMGLLTVGAVLFGGELSLAALLDWRPLPLGAPIGGLCLIAGWIIMAAAAVGLMFRRP